MSEWIKTVLKHFIIPLAGILAYIGLQFFAPPYFARLGEYNVSTNTVHTYVVVNPHCWSSRSPMLVFPGQSNYQIVSRTPGVNIERNDGDLICKPSTLAPGNAYHVVIQRPLSNAVTSAKLTCDGRIRDLHESITFDRYYMIMNIACLILLGVCSIQAIVLFFRNKKDPEVNVLPKGIGKVPAANDLPKGKLVKPQKAGSRKAIK